MGYIITLLLLCLAYAAVVYAMKYMKNFTAASFIFVGLVYLPYLALCFVVYSDVGFYDWNFQNLLPVANISPFCFFFAPLLLILPKKPRGSVYLLVSLLTVGMFLSSVFGCIYNASINYKFHIHFVLDYVAHFALSLYGIYLIRTKKACLNIKNACLSSSIIVGVAIFMMLLNVIFDTSFFGLSPNGKHNIYNNVLVDNSYLSALLYFIGLLFVLFMGYCVSKIFNNKKFSIVSTSKHR